MNVKMHIHKTVVFLTTVLTDPRIEAHLLCHHVVISNLHRRKVYSFVRGKEAEEKKQREEGKRQRGRERGKRQR